MRSAEVFSIYGNSPEFNKEKFAELIVQECYNIAYDGDGILEYFGIDK